MGLENQTCTFKESHHTCIALYLCFKKYTILGLGSPPTSLFLVNYVPLIVVDMVFFLSAMAITWNAALFSSLIVIDVDVLGM